MGLFQRRHIYGQQTHEGMFDTANHQRSANQSHSEILPHICQHDYQKNLPKLARMWRNLNPCILLVRMKTGAAIMENTTEIAPKIKNRDTIWSSNSIHWYIRKKMKTLIPKHIWTPMFIAAFFTIAKAWEQSKSPSTTERIEKMYNRHTHTQTHTYTHTYRHTQTHTQTHAQTETHTDTHRHTHRRTHTQGYYSATTKE